jgi:hypothetical protein
MPHGEKKSWEIGDTCWMAIKENGGWRAFGTMGMPGIEICEEHYFESPIEDIMRWSAEFTAKYAAVLLRKAETFNPESE